MFLGASVSSLSAHKTKSIHVAHVRKKTGTSYGLLGAGPVAKAHTRPKLNREYPIGRTLRQNVDPSHRLGDRAIARLGFIWMLGELVPGNRCLGWNYLVRT